MPEEAPDRRQRLETQVGRLRSTINILSGVLSAAFLFLCALAVWMMKDYVPPYAVVLYAVPVVLFGYLAFCFYTVLLFLMTEPQPGTPLKSILLWWHGLGVLVVIGLGVIGAMLRFVYVVSFSGMFLKM